MAEEAINEIQRQLALLEYHYEQLVQVRNGLINNNRQYEAIDEYITITRQFVNQLRNGVEDAIAMQE